MSAKLVKWNAIRNIQKGGTAIAVSWAEKTTGWERPTGFPAPSVKEDFVKAVENNKSRLPPGTAIVAMKYVFGVRCIIANYWYFTSGNRSIKATKTSVCITLPFARTRTVMTCLHNTWSAPRTRLEGRANEVARGIRPLNLLCWFINCLGLYHLPSTWIKWKPPKKYKEKRSYQLVGSNKRSLVLLLLPCRIRVTFRPKPRPLRTLLSALTEKYFIKALGSIQDAEDIRWLAAITRVKSYAI